MFGFKLIRIVYSQKKGKDNHSIGLEHNPEVESRKASFLTEIQIKLIDEQKRRRSTRETYQLINL